MSALAEGAPKQWILKEDQCSGIHHLQNIGHRPNNLAIGQQKICYTVKEKKYRKREVMRNLNEQGSA